MDKWSAEIMSDPTRNAQLHVELLEEGVYRGRLYKDGNDQLQLQVYKTDGTVIPLNWLLEIVQRFAVDVDLRSADEQ